MKFTDEEAREYIERVEHDTSLPAGQRLKLLTDQGLWSEKLWEESKAEVVPKLQAEITKPIPIQEEAKPQIPEAKPVPEDLIKVKFSLADPKTQLMMETINYLSKRFPQLPTIKSMEYLRYDKQLLGDLLDHLKRKGIIII